MPAAVQAVEIRSRVNPKKHGLAVDHERTDTIAQRGLGDQRKPAAPVMAVAGPEPDALAVALDDQPVVYSDLRCSRFITFGMFSIRPAKSRAFRLGKETA